MHAFRQVENRRLSAKLKEALSVQPAAVDPRELAKAEDRIRALMKENELFKAQLTQKPATPSPAPDLTAKLVEQNDVITALRGENEILKKQTAEWRQKYDAAATATTTARNSTTSPPPEMQAVMGKLNADNIVLQKQVELWKQVARNNARQPGPEANGAMPRDAQRELALMRARLSLLARCPRTPALPSVNTQGGNSVLSIVVP